jgi:GTP-binding protein LepA
MQHIRNFCIIAHIDHGRVLWPTAIGNHPYYYGNASNKIRCWMIWILSVKEALPLRVTLFKWIIPRMVRSITFNLIDTPGHVDFSYEVSRSIAACEGALLLVDCTQGIQAQTISNLYLAIEHNLEIIPIVNKIDMDGAMIEEAKDQIVDLIGCTRESIIEASGKTGIGVDEILRAIVERIPAPKGDVNAPLQALIFDSVFNSYRGVVAYYRIYNGTLKKGDKVKFVHSKKEYLADEVGILRLEYEPRQEVRAGDVGYIITGIKQAKEIKVGDTICPHRQGQ